MASPSDGSLSSGGLDQGSDAPTRDYEREVSDRIKRRKSKHVDKDEEVKLCQGFGWCKNLFTEKADQASE